jgi:hypothetical protein
VIRNEPELGTILAQIASGSYWIISSARCSSDGGTVRPSAFALFILIAHSSLVGCSTGNHPVYDVMLGLFIVFLPKGILGSLLDLRPLRSRTARPRT